MRFSTLLFISLAISCKGDDATTTDSGDDDDDVGCQTEILEFFPADGDGAVYYRTAIEFTLSDADGSESIAVSSTSGDVAGTSAMIDSKVVFTPDAPLLSSTQYSVTLDWCTGPTTTQWTTSEVGGPVDDNGLIGSTFSLDLASGRFVDPPGIGPLIQQQIPGDLSILIGVADIVGSDISIMGALGLGDDTQDLCLPSIDFPVAADFSENPYFVVGPDRLELTIADITVAIDDLMISGAFGPDGAYLAGAVLAGEIDSRPLVGLVGATGDDGAICDLAVTFGVTCQTCASDSEPYCLSVFVDSIDADGVPGLTLVSVDQAAVDANIDCQ